MNDEIKQYLQAGKKNLMMVYILYLCGPVMPMFPVIGAIFVYLNKDISDSMFATHYNFLIRTFWLALIGKIVTEIIADYLFFGNILYIPFVIWFICRVVIGFKYLIDNRSHPNPLTFWIR